MILIQEQENSKKFFKKKIKVKEGVLSKNSINFIKVIFILKK